LVEERSWNSWRKGAFKTRSIFDRYNIVSESDLEDAATRIEQGAIPESGHTMGIVEQPSQPVEVQSDTKRLYNQ
jgi:hypothetical protein